MMFHMRNFIVSDIDDKRQIFEVISERFPRSDLSCLRKAIRNRDIKINDIRIRKNTVVFSGDLVEVYISDDDLGLNNPSGTKSLERTDKFKNSFYKLLFNDENLIIVNKKPGIAVHSAKGSNRLSLVDVVREEFNNDGINLCHRIDMNTGGIVLLATNQKLASEISALIKDGRIIKRYRCLVRGFPTVGEPVRSRDNANMLQIKAYLEKNRVSNEVYIHDSQKPGDLEIITRYRVLNKYNGAGPEGESVSELEVELLSGGTHQIRSHMAHIGHPIIGDGKYGRKAYNKFFKTSTWNVKYQQLTVTSIIFGDIPRSNSFAYLSKKTFKCPPDFDVNF